MSNLKAKFGKYALSTEEIKNVKGSLYWWLDDPLGRDDDPWSGGGKPNYA